MRLLKVLAAVLLLASCERPAVAEINLSEYFKGIDGTAVFFNPSLNEYKIYNLPLSVERSSPCSTFKIMSSYIALSEHLITPQNSTLKWNRKMYGLSLWNKDMDLSEAFRTSCVWYFRLLIDRLSPDTVKTYLQDYRYGNRDISDWRGSLNDNTDQRELKGFWIESSLRISPVEQVDVLAKIFNNKTPAAATLKKIMLVETSPVKIYGKTGLGIKDNMVQNAWFVGFYEKRQQPVFFAVRLADKENKIQDYRHQASRYAREIALDIIRNADIF